MFYSLKLRGVAVIEFSSPRLHNKQKLVDIVRKKPQQFKVFIIFANELRFQLIDEHILRFRNLCTVFLLRSDGGNEFLGSGDSKELLPPAYPVNKMK